MERDRSGLRDLIPLANADHADRRRPGLDRRQLDLPRHHARGDPALNGDLRLLSEPPALEIRQHRLPDLDRLVPPRLHPERQDHDLAGSQILAIHLRGRGGGRLLLQERRRQQQEDHQSLSPRVSRT
jgi:hypothetical protein